MGKASSHPFNIHSNRFLEYLQGFTIQTKYFWCQKLLSLRLEWHFGLPYLLRIFDLQVNSAAAAWARIEKRIWTRLNTQWNIVQGLSVVQIAFLFLFWWTGLRCSWHGRWKCFQPTSLELWSASLSLVGHRKLHDNILNRCINTYLHS